MLCHHNLPCSEEKRVADVLQSQIAEIKRREEEAAQMEQERASLLREQAELERVVRTAAPQQQQSRESGCVRMFLLVFFSSSNVNVAPS